MLNIPQVRGVNSTAPPMMGGGSIPTGDGESMSRSPERVGWRNKGNRNPNGFGGGMERNPDSGGGTSFSLRSPRVASGVVGPGPGGARMALGDQGAAAGFGKLARY